jgi:hypothetical protein
MSQKSDQGPSAQTVGAVKPQGPRLRVEAAPAGNGNERLGASDLMERVCERPNLQAALKRVRRNAGSPGIDGMTVEDVKSLGIATPLSLPIPTPLSGQTYPRSA